MTRCGRPNCRCHADPPRLHGPYHQWTRKKDGKTATRILTDGQLAGYQPWFDNPSPGGRSSRLSWRSWMRSMPAPGLSNGRQRGGRANGGHRPGTGIWLRMPPSAWWLGLVAGILELVLGFWASQQRFPAAGHYC